jgi:hypothetical protein
MSPRHIGPVQALASWAGEHRGEIQEARACFDRKNARRKDAGSPPPPDPLHVRPHPRGHLG